jgi:hypothetical protein
MGNILPKAFAQCSMHRDRHEGGDVSAKAGDLADERGGQEGVWLRWGQEERFDPRGQSSVHAGQLEFELEIGHRPQTPHDDIDILSGGEGHQQAAKGDDLDARQVANRCPRQF